MRPVMLALLLLAATAMPPTAPALPDLGEDSCGGEAPHVTSCTTGERMPLTSTQEVTAGPDYTGVIVTELSWYGGVQGTMCSFEAGVRGTCIDYGGGMPSLGSGATSTHQCYSRDRTGAPGGTGTWSCTVIDVV